MGLLYNMVGSDPRKVHSMSSDSMDAMDSIDSMYSLDSMYSIDSMYSRDSVDSVCVDSVDSMYKA